MTCGLPGLKRIGTLLRYGRRLFCSVPGAPDLGWANQNVRPIIIPIAGDHSSMFVPQHLNNLVMRFVENMCRSDMGGNPI